MNTPNKTTRRKKTARNAQQRSPNSTPLAQSVILTIPPLCLHISARCQELLVEAGTCCNVNAKTGRPDLIRLHQILEELLRDYLREINALVAWGTFYFPLRQAPHYFRRECALIVFYTTLITAIITEIAYVYVPSRLPEQANDLVNDIMVRILNRLENQEDRDTTLLNWPDLQHMLRYLQTVCNSATATRANWLNKLPGLLAFDDDARFSAFKQ